MKRFEEPDDDHVVMFVYGTLRPYPNGDCPYGFDEGVLDRMCCAQTGGRLYLARHQGFPYANFDQVGVIHGDLTLWDRHSPEYLHVTAMESQAGYEQRTIRVMVKHDHDQAGGWLDAVAWHSPHTQGLLRIDSGDWNDHVSRRRPWWV